MGALKELFGTDVGLLSLGVILFIIGMAVWFFRFFQRHIREEEAQAAVGARAGATRKT